MKQTIHVVAVALFDSQKRVLIVQRSIHDKWAGWWEFPGGKVEEGESPIEALVREIDEELDVQLFPLNLDFIETLDFEAKDKYLRFTLYRTQSWKGIITLKEHQALQWLLPQEIDPSILLEPDQPFVGKLI